MTGGSLAGDARAKALKRLGKEPFDLLIVGGGIVGAGVARDAALRGYKVALVERGDFAQGTSSRSSKMVHGGLRYLESRAFRLVSEACAERRVLQRIAPHLVRPRSFVLPAYAGEKPSRFEVALGLWLYDAMAVFRNTRMHRGLTAARLADMEPALRRDGLAGGGLFFDCVTDDARLTLGNALDASALGAAVLNYAEVRAVEVEGGEVKGAVVADRRGEGEIPVKTRCVVNAAGPWSDEVTRMVDPAAKPRLRLTKGVHIVVPRERLGHIRALVLRTPQDHRVFFTVPWGSLSLVGTTDTDFEGPPSEPVAGAEDVRYLLKAVASYFPGSDLTKDDVVGAYAGLRPLMRVEGVDPSAVPREHEVTVGPRGFVSVIGGKLTTYRRMAGQVVDEAALSVGLPPRRSRTARRPLPGGRADPAQPSAAALALSRRFSLSEPQADALYLMHGSESPAVLEAAPLARRAPLDAGHPYLEASLAWAYAHERAQTLEDGLVRRVPIAIRLKDGGAGLAERAAAVAGGAAGWERAERESEVEGFLRRVQRENAWRRAF